VNAELAGLAYSTASRVADQRDKLRDTLREIEGVLVRGDWFPEDTLNNIQGIIEKAIVRGDM